MALIPPTLEELKKNEDYEISKNAQGQTVATQKAQEYLKNKQGKEVQKSSYNPAVYTYDAQGKLVSGTVYRLKVDYQKGSRLQQSPVAIQTYSREGDVIKQNVYELQSSKSGTREVVKFMETNVITPQGETIQEKYRNNLTPTQQRYQEERARKIQEAKKNIKPSVQDVRYASYIGSSTPTNPIQRVRISYSQQQEEQPGPQQIPIAQQQEAPNQFGLESISEAQKRNPVVAGEAKITAFIEAKQGTTAGILAGSAFSLYKFGKGFVEGSIAVINPKTYYDLVIAALNPKETREAFYSIGAEIERDPTALAEIAGEIKGFTKTSQAIISKAVRGYASPKTKETPPPATYYQNEPERPIGTGRNPLKTQDLIGGGSQVDLGKKPADLSNPRFGGALQGKVGRGAGTRPALIYIQEEQVRGAVPITTSEAEIQRVVQLRSLAELRAAQGIAKVTYAAQQIVSIGRLANPEEKIATSQQSAQVQKEKTAQITPQVSITKEVQDYEVLQIPTSALLSEQAGKQLTRNRLVVIQSSGLEQIQQTEQATRQESVQVQDLIQEQVSLQQQVQDTKLLSVQVPIATLENKQQRKEDNGLFETFVRRRGRFEIVGRFADPEEAIRAGARIVQGTAAASFKVTGDGSVLEYAAQGLNPSQFRESRREPGVVIERVSQRINTPGELGEITFKGISISRSKGKKKRRGFNVFGGF